MSNVTPQLGRGAATSTLASDPRAENGMLQVQLIGLIKSKFISDRLRCGLGESNGSFRLTLLDGFKEEAVAS